MAVDKVVDFPVVQDVQISLSCMMPDIMADIDQKDSYALHWQGHVQGWFCL